MTRVRDRNTDNTVKATDITGDCTNETDDVDIDSRLHGKTDDDHDLILG